MKYITEVTVTDLFEIAREPEERLRYSKDTVIKELIRHASDNIKIELDLSEGQFKLRSECIIISDIEGFLKDMKEIVKNSTSNAQVANLLWKKLNDNQ